MDLALAQQLEGELRQELALDRPLERVVFDLARVNYVASAFLRVCVSTVKHAGRGGLSIVNTSPQIMKLFKTAGLSDLIGVS